MSVSVMATPCCWHSTFRRTDAKNLPFTSKNNRQKYNLKKYIHFLELKMGLTLSKKKRVSFSLFLAFKQIKDDTPVRCKFKKL